MTTYQWNQLGINEITNQYLYGQTTTPRQSVQKHGRRITIWLPVNLDFFT